MSFPVKVDTKWGLDVKSTFYLRAIDPNYLYSSHPYFKVGTSCPINSQGYIGTGRQHCHLWELIQHRGDNLTLEAKLANH